MAQPRDRDQLALTDRTFECAARAWLKASPERVSAYLPVVDALAPAIGAITISEIRQHLLEVFDLVVQIEREGIVDGRDIVDVFSWVVWDESVAFAIAESAGIVCAVLTDDLAFAQCVESVRASDQPTVAAADASARYATRREHRQPIATLLLATAANPSLSYIAARGTPPGLGLQRLDRYPRDRRGLLAVAVERDRLNDLRLLYTAITGRQALYDHPSGTRARSPRADTHETIMTGARHLARRGAGLCLYCGATLETTHGDSPAGRLVRRHFCNRHAAHNHDRRRFGRDYEWPVREAIRALRDLFDAKIATEKLLGFSK